MRIKHKLKAVMMFYLFSGPTDRWSVLMISVGLMFVEGLVLLALIDSHRVIAIVIFFILHIAAMSRPLTLIINDLITDQPDKD